MLPLDNSDHSLPLFLRGDVLTPELFSEVQQEEGVLIDIVRNIASQHNSEFSVEVREATDDHTMVVHGI